MGKSNQTGNVTKVSETYLEPISNIYDGTFLRAPL